MTKKIKKSLHIKKTSKVVTNSGRPQSQEFNITYEILPPGTLKRKGSKKEKPDQRWYEVFNICSEIIAEYARKEDFF